MSGVPTSELIKFAQENPVSYNLDPEDQEAIESILGIEIRTMYEDADEHEGYYDTIDDAIDALNDMRKLFPHLCRKES